MIAYRLILDEDVKYHNPPDEAFMRQKISDLRKDLSSAERRIATLSNLLDMANLRAEKLAARLDRLGRERTLDKIDTR